MKKWIKYLIFVIGLIVLGFLIDIICIFVINRPLFAIKEDNGDSVNIIYKGLFYDTYNCFESSTSQIIFKGTKFSCSQNIKINEFVNYDFEVVVTTPNENKKTFAFKHNDINYYYGNTNFKLYLSENNVKYDLETSLINDLVSFDDLLSKAKKIEVTKNNNWEIYHYNLFYMVVCNNDIDETNVIIREDILGIENVCE